MSNESTFDLNAAYNELQKENLGLRHGLIAKTMELASADGVLKAIRPTVERLKSR